MAAYILLKPEQQPQVIVKEVPGAAPSVADKDKDDDKDKEDDEDEDEDKEDEEDEETAGEADPEETEVASASGKKPSRKSKGKKGGGTKKPSSSDPLAGFDDPPAKKPTSTKKPTGGGKKGDVSVDCILDPSKCKKGGSKKSSGGSSKPAPADSNLPATLTSSDIRAGVAPYKSAAKACGGKHGASKGTKVRVKLSITGSSGTVASASAESPHKGTPLGNCVAAAVKRAKFKKFGGGSPLVFHRPKLPEQWI